MVQARKLDHSPCLVAYDAMPIGDHKITGGHVIARNWVNLIDSHSTSGFQFIPWNVWSKDRKPTRWETLYHMLFGRQFSANKVQRQAAPDILLYFMPPAAWVSSVPQIMYIHDVPLQREYRAQVDRFYNNLMMLTAKRCKCIWTSTDVQKQRVADKGMPLEKIEVMPYPIDPVYWQETLTQPVNEKKSVLVVLSSLLWRKNPEAIFKIYQHLPLKIKNNLNFIIAGQVNALPAQIPAELRGLLPKFQLIDSPTNETLAKLYREAVCTVMLSRYEGYGMPVAESMAAGTPVIISNDPALKEVSGKGGVACDAEDYRQAAYYLCKLVTEPEFTGRLSKKAYQESHKYGEEILYQRFLDLIQKVHNAT